MNPDYFLEVIRNVLEEPDAFSGYDVVVYEGPRSEIADAYSVQIYPVKLKEQTRAEGVLACTDTWKVSGRLKALAEAPLSGDESRKGLLRFMEDVKKALDKMGNDEEEFTFASLPDTAVLYETYPDIVFDMQLEISYLRRI